MSDEFNLSSNQLLWETIDVDGRQRKVTSNKDRTKYYLWELINDKWERIEQKDSPLELDRR